MAYHKRGVEEFKRYLEQRDARREEIKNNETRELDKALRSSGIGYSVFSGRLVEAGNLLSAYSRDQLEPSMEIGQCLINGRLLKRLQDHLNVEWHTFQNDYPELSMYFTSSVYKFTKVKGEWIAMDDIVTGNNAVKIIVTMEIKNKFLE